MYDMYIKRKVEFVAKDILEKRYNPNTPNRFRGDKKDVLKVDFSEANYALLWYDYYHYYDYFYAFYEYYYYYDLTD